MPSASADTPTGLTFQPTAIAATLNAHAVNPGNILDAQEYFEYGPTTAYGYSTKPVPGSMRVTSAAASIS